MTGGESATILRSSLTSINMDLSHLKIVVVGGATGGCAAALLLARAGARVQLIERVAEPRAVGAGIALAENGHAVLQSLGLEPALSVARPVDGVRITDAKGRTLLVPPRPTPRISMLRRSTLQQILLDAVAGEARIEGRFGTEVVDARSDGTVTVRSLATDEEETIQADLIIGADGVHSCVRWCGTFDARIRQTGLHYMRALVDEGVATGVEAWTGAGVFGSFAVDGGIYLFASCGTAECRAALLARDLDALRAAWARAYAPAGELLAAVRSWDQLIINEVIRVDCRRWVDGRLALLGDAAHAMAPNLGQGANSALVDASVLLDELRNAPDVPSALASYESRRKPAVRHVADAAQRLGQVSELTNPVARWTRDHLLAPIVNMLATERATNAVLQESPRRLLAIGRA
jgi:2-polyprenyl-6-methoxyphenol hydroxylase-like FAD-dependent oxidoreductase